MKTTISAIAAVLLATSAWADNWYPSKYGADDTLGAINNLSPELVVKAAKLVTTGKTYALSLIHI